MTDKKHILGWIQSGIILFVFSCGHPTGVDRPGLFTTQSPPLLSTNKNTSWESVLGDWEVVMVEGKNRKDVSQEKIPFEKLSIDRYGRIRLDTFQTEYELISEKDGSIVLSYSSLGRESFLSIRLTEDDIAEIVETHQNPVTGELQEWKVTVRRIL